jgi:hypothetical protein
MNNGLSPAAKNFYFYPMSWRGPTSTTGTTVYRLNNGDFVAVNSTTTPQIQEIGVGVVSINTLSAWGAIIDLNTQTLYYNYSAYTPSFSMDRATTEALYIKIFNKYSSSIDQAQVFANVAKVAPLAGTSLYGWTAWDGTTGNVYGDFTTSTTAPNTYSLYAPHNQIWYFNSNIPPGGDAVYTGGGIQMLHAAAIQSPNYWGYQLFPAGGGSNLLPWVDADVFLLHGTYYAYNNTYIYQISLTNGSSGVVQGAPVAVAYAIGLTYLCVSPNKAYFLSNYDNSVYYFDGGRSLVKLFEANQKPQIQAGAYNVRDNALYLETIDSIITIRDEQSGAINSEGLQITENDLPSLWSATSYLKSTANGLYFIMGQNIAVRSYYSGLTLINLDYRTAHYSPAEWKTMQIQRIGGQIWCSLNKNANLTLTLYYIRVDGTSGSVSAAVDATTRNVDGYSRFAWTPSVSNVIAGSVRVQHTSSEQKIVLMELVMYYTDGAEVIPLTEVSAEL